MIKITGWIGSIFAFLIATVTIVQSVSEQNVMKVPIGLCFLLVGLSANPKVYEVLVRRGGRAGPTKAVAGIVIGLLIAIFLIAKDAGSNKFNTPADDRGEKIESAFLTVLAESKMAYSKPGNQYEKSKLRIERAKKIREVLNDSRTFASWRGEVVQMGTTPERWGYLEIRLLGSDVVLRTWNSSVLDAFDGSLIEPSSTAYEAVSKLSVGQKVLVSGTILSGSDYLKDASLTESGSMNRPEFITKFETVSAAL